MKIVVKLYDSLGFCKPYEKKSFNDFETAVAWAVIKAQESIEGGFFENDDNIAKFSFDEDWLSLDDDIFFFKDLVESDGEVALSSIRAELNYMIQILYHSYCTDYAFKFEEI